MAGPWSPLKEMMLAATANQRSSVMHWQIVPGGIHNCRFDLKKTDRRQQTDTGNYPHIKTSQSILSFEDSSKIQNSGFLTVLIIRLTFLPFDLVGYSSGMCNIKQRDFALATLIGTIPGLLTFVFLGGSVLDFRYLLLALFFLLPV